HAMRTRGTLVVPPHFTTASEGCGGLRCPVTGASRRGLLDLGVQPRAREGLHNRRAAASHIPAALWTSKDGCYLAPSTLSAVEHTEASDTLSRYVILRTIETRMEGGCRRAKPART